jgi:hypothetical protein
MASGNQADDDDNSNYNRALRNVADILAQGRRFTNNTELSYSDLIAASAVSVNRQRSADSNYLAQFLRGSATNDGLRNELARIQANNIASLQGSPQQNLGLSGDGTQSSILRYLAAPSQQVQQDRHLNFGANANATNIHNDAVDTYLNEAAMTSALQGLMRERSLQLLPPLLNNSFQVPPETSSQALVELLMRRQELNNLSAPQMYQAGVCHQPQGNVLRNESNSILYPQYYQMDSYSLAANRAASLSASMTNIDFPSREQTNLSILRSNLDRKTLSNFSPGVDISDSPFEFNSSAHSRSEGETKSAAVRNFVDLSNDVVTWEDLVKGSTLTAPELRGMVSDVHFAVMAQMKTCTLTHEDRVGLYKTREIGCRGICCKHCGGVPGFGRYFPGSLSSLVNGNITKSSKKHLLEECRACPSHVREGIQKLEDKESISPFHYQRGSRRQFFALVWNNIQEGQLKDDHFTSNAEAELCERIPTFHAATLVTTKVSDSDDHILWTKILEGSTVVLMTDRHLVPDTIFAATAQTKPCAVTEEDRVGRCKDHKLGSMGLCCKHCEGKPGAFGRYFPSNLHTFAQVEVCNQIVKHLTSKCLMCPPEIRDAIVHLQLLEQTIPSKRFPSRMVFFRRVWHRFHYGDSIDGNPEDNDDSDVDDTEPIPSSGAGTADEISWDNLLKGSTLVSMDDQGLISDSQFAAIAQMDRCKLVSEDRIGYNKDKQIGFVGLACRYCGGRPGFGRYFPNSVRNFEKTSARDTIVSHISTFCKKCPDDVRDDMQTLQRVESSRSGSATMKGLVYGSGKIFFRRLWSRLHGEDEIDVDDVKLSMKRSSIPEGSAESNSSSDSSDNSSNNEESKRNKKIESTGKYDEKKNMRKSSESSMQDYKRRRPNL